jgi:hypothetical protein
MISIYSNNHYTDNLIQLLNFKQPYQVYHSINDYVAANSTVKFAFVQSLNSRSSFESNEERLKWVTNGNGFSKEIQQLTEPSSLLFAFDNEIHPYHRDLFEKHCSANTHWVIPGHLNDTLVNQQNVILWNFILNETKKFYSNILFKLQELTHNKEKPLMFDALLGMPRLHRDFLYQEIKQNCVGEKIKLTYLRTDLDDNSVKFEWDCDVNKFEVGNPDTINLAGTWQQFSYYGQQQPLSRIIPIDVYNQTAYSIIAETGFENFYSFYTEKTAKAILAKRLFVMFSGYKFLENLRKSGFETFGNVIDESYDLIPDNQQRWSAAFEQVKKLCNMDQQEVFEKVSAAVEHNYSLLMNTDWEQHMITHLQQKINQFLLS